MSFSRMRLAMISMIGLRLPHGDARLQLHHQVVVLVAAILRGVRAQRQRDEDIGLVHGAFGGHHFRIEPEIRPQHARHGEWLAVEGDAAADRS